MIGDTLPPSTSASPSTGTFPAFFEATLTSNEPATIYYTTDGSFPSVGATTTSFGPSPITGIMIDHELTLRYFAIDTAENVESSSASFYFFDLSPPELLLCSTYPGPYGFYEEVDVCFLSNETVSYSVEVGGDGTVGDGSTVGTGFLATGFESHVNLPTWQLGVGSQNPGASMWIHLTDSAGGTTSAEQEIPTLNPELIPVSGLSNDIELTSDGLFGYVLRPELAQVWKFDTDSASPSFNTILSMIDVALNPTGMTIVADNTRLYITGDGGFTEVDVVTDTPTGFPMTGSLTPTGLAIQESTSFAFCGASNGTYWRVDIDPMSANYLVPQQLSIQPNFLDVAEIVFVPDETKALVTWQSDSFYKLQILDTDPMSSGYLISVQELVSAPAPVVIGSPIINQGGTTGWASNEFGRLTRFDLAQDPVVMGFSSASLSVRGMTLAPDEAVMFLTGVPLDGIRVVHPGFLSELTLVPSKGASGSGTARAMRYTADGKRAYLIRDNGSATAEIWMLWLTAQ